MSTITDAAGLNKFVADAKQKMADLDAANATNGERLKTIEQLAAQLSGGIDTIRREQEQRAQYVATGGDADVVRAYCAPEMASDEAEASGIRIADLRKGQAVSDRGARWAGSSGGVVRLFGGVEDGRWEYGLLDDPKPKSTWQHEAQIRAEEVAWVRAVKGQVPTRMVRSLRKHMERGPEQVAKVFADNSGEGGEWIIAFPMAELQRAAELPRQVEGLFPSMNVSAAQGTMPFLSTGIQPFVHNVPSSGDLNPGHLPKSVPVTSDASYAVATMTLNLPADMDAIEDSIVDFLPFARMMIAEGDRDGTEDAIINGDSTATHGDTAFATWNPRSRWSTLGASNDHRKAWIGLRHRAIDLSNNSDYNATQTVSDYMGGRVKLNSAHAFGDLAYITSPEHYIAKILRDTNVLTVDKYGPSASVLTGEVARIGGHPLIISDFVTSDLATSGLYTGSGSTTSLILVNRSRFRMLRLRSMRFEVASRAEYHTTYIVASSRKLFKTFDSSSTKNVASFYNLSAS